MKKALLIHPEELTKKWIDRMKDNGCSTLAFHPEGGVNAAKSLAKLTEQIKEDKAFCGLIDYAKAQGLTVEYEMHAARYLLPEELFETHPEYFRMNAEGQRTPDFNLCASSDAAVSVLADRAAALAKSLYGSSPNYYFWMDDKKESKCFCKQCQKLSASDQQLKILNVVIKRLRSEIPEARLAYLAYYDTMPVPETVKPEPGIFLEYAPFERDFTKGATAMPDSEKKNITDLLAFFGKENSAVLEYWYDNSMYSDWKKPPKKLTPDNALIQKDLAFYRAFGFEKISSFACFLGEDYEELYGEPDISAFQI